METERSQLRVAKVAGGGASKLASTNNMLVTCATYYSPKQLEICVSFGLKEFHKRLESGTLRLGPCPEPRPLRNCALGLVLSLCHWASPHCPFNHLFNTFSTSFGDLWGTPQTIFSKCHLRPSTFLLFTTVSSAPRSSHNC